MEIVDDESMMTTVQRSKARTHARAIHQSYFGKRRAIATGVHKTTKFVARFNAVFDSKLIRHSGVIIASTLANTLHLTAPTGQGADVTHSHLSRTKTAR